MTTVNILQKDKNSFEAQERVNGTWHTLGRHLSIDLAQLETLKRAADGVFLENLRVIQIFIWKKEQV